MGSWHQRLTLVLVMAMCFTATFAEDDPPTFENRAEGKASIQTIVETPVVATSGDIKTGANILEKISIAALGALENVDEMLRTTVPDVDRLQCLERFMCEMSSGSIMKGINDFINPSTPPPILPMPQPIAQFPNFADQNPSFQQGFQQFQQRPVQTQPSQFHQFQQPPQQGFPQVHPQSFPQQSPQQGFPQVHPQSFPQQGLPHNPAFQQQLINPNQVQQTFDPTFQQGGFVSNPGFQQFPSGHPSQQVPAHHFSQFRESSSSDDNTIRREGEARPVARPLRRKKLARPGIMGIIENIFGGRTKRSTVQAEQNKRMESRNLSRKKRGLFDSVLNTFNAFTPDMMLRLVDQYMIGQQNSLYPYTHASMMGYTGNPQRCERLYPTCPTNPDEMIHVFNNIRRYYPEGMPFADQLPWPLRDLFK